MSRLVYGRLIIRDGEEVIDLANVGPGGRAIHRFNDGVEIISSDATSIVIVEKEAVANRLAQSRWWERARCIMICTTGFPSLSTRELVRNLIDTLKIPARIFVDADPAGVLLALTVAHGSISTALETPWLACNDLWWAGLCPSDAEAQSPRALIRLTESDAEACRTLLAHPSHTYVNDRVRKAVAITLDRGSKAELDSLVHGTSHLEDFMLQKLEHDLIKL